MEIMQTRRFQISWPNFFVASYDSINKISLTGNIRNDVLETLVRYYSLHLPGLKKIKSLDILKEVFS
jgi:DNA repair protein RecO (recombination protein O)